VRETRRARDETVFGLINFKPGKFEPLSLDHGKLPVKYLTRWTTVLNI
jgi:hypothetical protein